MFTLENLSTLELRTTAPEKIIKGFFNVHFKILTFNFYTILRLVSFRLLYITSSKLYKEVKSYTQKEENSLILVIKI